MSRFLKMLISGIVATVIVGCGSSSVPMPQGTVVPVTFAGTTAPQAVATQVGGGAFMQASLQAGNTVNLVLPTGTTKYAIAYVCAGFSDEFIFEATVQDSAALTVSCPGFGTSNLGMATGSVDASAIPGVTNVDIVPGGVLGGVSGPFSVNMPAGSDDVGFLAFGSTGNVLGVKILRSQSIPGVINGGNTVLFGPGDATIVQPGTINNVPANFFQPGVAARYHTANGASLTLNTVVSAPPMYPAVPAAATQSGDFYLYSTSAVSMSPFTQQIGMTQTTTNGGGPVTLRLPAPWSYSGPVPAAFPTFTFNYSGFSGLPAVSQQVLIIWPTGPTSRNLIMVTATANFQNGATTLTLPDLTSLPGFFAPAPSNTQISWIADIFGGTTQEYIFSINPPSNGSVAFVENRGSYIQP
jgi:hypothetical protein